MQTDNSGAKMAVALIALVFLGFLLARFKEKEANQQLKRMADVKYDSVKHWRDKYNTEHARADEAVGDLLDANVLYRNDMDSVCERLNLKPSDRKHISTVTEVGTVATGHVSVPLLPRSDTVHDTVCRPFTWSDAWTWFKGNVCKDSVSFDWGTEDSLIMVAGDWEKKWMLGGRVRTIDAYSLNPHVHIKGLTALHITEDKPGRWGVGPFAGIAVMPGDNWLRPVIGVSIHYSLIRF